MPNYFLKLEYNGAGFHGWQKQPNVRTIQEELEKSLEIVLKQKIKKLTASGRTDSGVHAKAQVVNFFVENTIDLDRLILSVSSILKGELSVIEAKEAPLKFDACRSAKEKIYTYRILNRKPPPVLNKEFVWHVTSELNVDKLSQDLDKLVGEHDFTSFRASGCGARSPVKKIIGFDVCKKNNLITVDIHGKGFLKQMVRNIIGTAIDLQLNNISISMRDILLAKDRTQAGRTAPARGLCLKKVIY